MEIEVRSTDYEVEYVTPRQHAIGRISGFYKLSEYHHIIWMGF